MDQSTASSDISSAEAGALRFNPTGESIFPLSYPRIWQGSPIVAVMRRARFRVSATFPAVSRKLTGRTAAAISTQAENFNSTEWRELPSNGGQHHSIGTLIGGAAIQLTSLDVAQYEPTQSRFAGKARQLQRDDGFHRRDIRLRARSRSGAGCDIELLLDDALMIGLRSVFERFRESDICAAAGGGQSLDERMFDELIVRRFGGTRTGKVYRRFRRLLSR